MGWDGIMLFYVSQSYEEFVVYFHTISLDSAFLFLP